MGDWKFLLADSYNTNLTSGINADITNEAKNKQLTLSHNRSGNCTFNLPLTIDNLDYTQTNQKCILCLKNDKIVWSGPIWTRSIDFDAERIDISCVGWFEILMNRFLWNKPGVPAVNIPDYSGGSGTQEHMIVAGLLNIANSDHDTWISLGTVPSSSSLRKIKYEIWQSIGEEIVNLSDIEDGFDIYMDPETRELNIRDASDFDDKTNIPFGYNWGANNISNLIVEENGGERRNRIQVVGGNNTVWTYPTGEPTTNQNNNNLMTEIIQVTESKDDAVLQAIANAEGAIKENGIISYEITLKPQGPDNPYEIFEDYSIGDKISFVANKNVGGETISLSHEPRIFGASIDIDENGIERVSSLQTTFAG